MGLRTLFRRGPVLPGIIGGTLVVSMFFTGVLLHSIAHAALSCSLTTTCDAPNVIVLKLSSSTNAHAELPSQSNYAQFVCCSATTLGTSCSATTTATFLKLSSTTNAHVEQNTQSNYANNACLSISTGTVSVAYQSSNCSGFDTTVASMEATTNSHVGGPSAYTTKICASTNIPQSLTFTISDNTIGFGTLVPSTAHFATGDTVGTTTETEAHTIAVTTNAASGYAMTVGGATLTSGSFTIDAIGGTNTVSSPGTEQFGLRMSASGGSGTVSAPYAASGFAYAATATTTSQVASASVGDDVQTTYSTRYIANIASNTETASYSSFLTYAVTANF